MSEKRFYLDEEDRLCIHYDGRILASVGFQETEAQKIVDVLNKLSEENEQLRRYVYHCPQICNIILAYLRKCESEDVKAVSDAMDDDKYFDDDIDTLRSWE